MNQRYYRFVISKFMSFGEDECEEVPINIKENLTLLEALHMLFEFAKEHPDCHFQDRSYVELETEDAVLSAYIIDMPV